MGQKKYVKSCYYDDDQNLYGIFDNEKHIGNILVKGLLSVHKHAEITYVVGNTTYWGKGVATFAISKIISLARSKYKLNKLFAGVADKNEGSKKVLEKNGFILEGVRKKHVYLNNKFHDELIYGLVL